MRFNKKLITALDKVFVNRENEFRRKQLQNLLDSTMKSVNRKSRKAGYGDIMKTVRSK